MRFFGGQVDALEIGALVLASFFAFAMGYSLPVFALLLLLAWPILLFQMLLQGIFDVLFRGVRGLFRLVWPAKPKPAVPQLPVVPRTGAARFIWLIPLVTMTAGYGKYVIEAGRWFI